MISLVYSSRETRPFSGLALIDLLKISRANNARTGVTGLLLYRHGAFLQQLEGEEDAVDHVFRRIRADERHTDIRVLAADPVERRDYPQWTMGFSFPEPDELARHLDGYDPTAVSPHVDQALVNKPMARLLVAMLVGEL